MSARGSPVARQPTNMSLLMPLSGLRLSSGCPVTSIGTIYTETCIIAHILSYKVRCELLSNHFRWVTSVIYVCIDRGNLYMGIGEIRTQHTRLDDGGKFIYMHRYLWSTNDLLYTVMLVFKCSALFQWNWCICYVWYKVEESFSLGRRHSTCHQLCLLGITLTVLNLNWVFVAMSCFHPLYADCHPFACH